MKKSRRKATEGFIEDISARKTTFKKRKEGFFKKLHELVTLCDVKACAVVYDMCQPIPEAWPSREGAEEVVSKFRELPVFLQMQKMESQKEFLEKSIVKAKEHVEKLCEENRKLENQELMFSYLRGEKIVYPFNDISEFRDFEAFIEKYDNVLTHRREILMERVNVGEHSVDDIHHQPSTTNLMSSITTTTTDVLAPNVISNP